MISFSRVALTWLLQRLYVYHARIARPGQFSHVQRLFPIGTFPGLFRGDISQLCEDFLQDGATMFGFAATLPDIATSFFGSASKIFGFAATFHGFATTLLGLAARVRMSPFQYQSALFSLQGKESLHSMQTSLPKNKFSVKPMLLWFSTFLTRSFPWWQRMFYHHYLVLFDFYDGF